MRGRNRIKEEMSVYFRDEIAKPGILLEYKRGFQELIYLNKAYAKMLRQQGLLMADEERIILDGLEYVRTSFHEDDIDGRYEELYFNMEQKLLAKIGIAVGGKLHTGRSRNDIYAALWRMETRRSVLEICGDVIALEQQLLVLAEKYKDMILTGYTHMQPAQPITVGYYYTAAIEAIARDFARLQQVYARTNQCPLGAAALAGTGFSIDRKALEELLGFDGLVDNALDCVGAKDYLLEAESALAIMMVNISRMVQDHYIWCTNEFGYAEVGGEIAVCSSIMPQKKNPVTFEMIKSKASHAVGMFVSGCSILKNTPFSLCMDLFESHAEYWPGYESSRTCVQLFAETLRYMHFHEERAYQAAKGNFCTVTALADFLVQRFHISFSQAHDIVADMVAEAMERGGHIDAIDAELLRVISRRNVQQEFRVSDDEIRNVLEPARNVKGKRSWGSPGEESLAEMLQLSAQQIEAQLGWLKEQRERIEHAYQKLV